MAIEKKKTGRRVLLGVTGSIAAYKAVELLRLFVKNGDEVQVVMTDAATKFVAPLTFQTLSRNPVSVDSFAPIVNWKPEHIALSDWADLVVVAPATANTIAKMRYGIADNLLTETLLATRAPVVVAPTMNTGMWEAAATQENVAALKARGVAVIDPGIGELACGASGAGRMPDAEAIFDEIAKLS
jgi:phosphopantothenoylcysteine decarboxylase / phosphopantothenate---cysteine ligase